MTFKHANVSLVIERMNQSEEGGEEMDTFLTILMALGIYVVLPLIVAAVVCGAVIWRAKVRAERTEEVTTAKGVEELVHYSAKR
jgi:hypothetical protein